MTLSVLPERPWLPLGAEEGLCHRTPRCGGPQHHCGVVWLFFQGVRTFQMPRVSPCASLPLCPGGLLVLCSVQGVMSFGMPGMTSVAALQSVNPYAAQAVASPSGVGLQGIPLGAAAQAVGGGVSDNVCIKMRGLPFSASMYDILEFFKGYNVVENGVHVVVGPGERPTGEAYVEFATPEDAQRAMEKHRQHIGSRYVELFRVTKRSGPGPLLPTGHALLLACALLLAERSGPPACYAPAYDATCS